MELGKRLRTQRHALRLSGPKVAAQVGVSSVHISDMENDKRRPSLDLLVRLARVYGVTTDYLLGVEAGPAMPRDPYAEELAAILGELGEADKAALVEMGQALRRLARTRQGSALEQVFSQLMGEVEAAVGVDAAEALYSAVRAATAQGEMAPLREWLTRFGEARADEQPDPGE